MDLPHVSAFLGFDYLNQLHGVVCLCGDYCEAPFKLELLSEGSRSVSVFFFPSNLMVCVFDIPVVHRMLWHSAGLASKEGSANASASLSPGFLGGTWGLPEPYGKLSCSLDSARG